MNPSTSYRAYFKPDKAYEVVENVIAECFNSIIFEARKKPLITMLEEIRLYLMDRFYKMAQKANRWESDVCPAAVKKTNKFGETVRNWMVCPSGVNAFETRNGYEAYCVDLVKHESTCRLWNLFGIPCVHAQASIFFTHQDPVKFIGNWFSKEKFKDTYAQNLLPVNGWNLWAASPFIKPLPPIARSMTGRPSIKRRRHVSEVGDRHFQVGRARTTCTNCQEKGHNKVSCKKPFVAPEPKPKKKMGRPRMDPDVSHWTRGGHMGPRRCARGGNTRGGRGGNTRGGRAGLEEDVNFVDVKETHVETEHVDVQDTIRDMRTSEYIDEEIMDCLGLTNEEFIDIMNIKDIRADEEAVAGDQEEVVAGDQEEAVAVQRVRRRQSERITKMKLAKKIVDKYGTGTTSEKAVRKPYGFIERVYGAYGRFSVRRLQPGLFDALFPFLKQNRKF
ncbi:hypothetical protein LXL04_033100 [Taraxacum kok-saghyz]